MKYFAVALAVIIIIMAYLIFRNVNSIPQGCRMGIRSNHILSKQEMKEFPHHYLDDKWLAAHHIPTNKDLSQLNQHYMDADWMKAHGMFLVPCPKNVHTMPPAGN